MKNLGFQPYHIILAGFLDGTTGSKMNLAITFTLNFAHLAHTHTHKKNQKDAEYCGTKQKRKSKLILSFQPVWFPIQPSDSHYLAVYLSISPLSYFLSPSPFHPLLTTFLCPLFFSVYPIAFPSSMPLSLSFSLSPAPPPLYTHPSLSLFSPTLT